MTQRPALIVQAERSGRWWVLTVPGVPGVYSQVSRLADAEEYAREAIAFVLNTASDSFDIQVLPTLPEQSAEQVGAEIAAARAIAAEAEALQTKAGAASRRLVHKLLENGLSGPDVAAVLGVSQQRVSQLARDSSRKKARPGPTAGAPGRRGRSAS